MLVFPLQRLYAWARFIRRPYWSDYKRSISNILFLMCKAKVIGMPKVKSDPRARLIFDPNELDYNFGPDHPLQPRRIVALMDLLETSRLWHSADEQSRLSMRSATVEELSLAHTREYISAVQTLSTTGRGESLDGERLQLAIKHGFAEGDTPVLPRMHEVSACIAGGTLVALNAVMGITDDGSFTPEDE